MTNPDTSFSHHSPERNHQPVDYYFEFENEDQKSRAQQLFEQEIRLAENPLPHGPDGYFESSFDPKYGIIINNDPQRTEGLEISFKKTPNGFNSPEEFEKYLLTLLHKNNILLKKTDSGHDEAYEVVDGQPQ